MFFMLTLGSTKKCCVAQKTIVSAKKIFHIEVNVAHQNYVSQKNMLWQQKTLLTPRRILVLINYV